MSERDPVNTIAKDTEASAMPHGAAAAANVNNGGILVLCVAVVAVVMMGLSIGMSAWSMARTSDLVDEVAQYRSDDRAYRNDISVWETDVFNRQKTLEAMLIARGIDARSLGKLPPPPE